MRRSHDLSVQHSRTADVEGVSGAAGNLVGPVEPFYGRADYRKLLGPEIFFGRALGGRLRLSSGLKVLVVTHGSLPWLPSSPPWCASTSRTGRYYRRCQCSTEP